MFVYNGIVSTELPHPTLTQFTYKYFLDTFFSPDTNEGAGSISKWFYFYCNPVLDPLTIIAQHGTYHLHPGLKRFIGTAFREKSCLRTWVVSEKPLQSATGLKLRDIAYQGNDWEKWIEEQKTTYHDNTQIKYYIKKYLRNNLWALELEDSRTFYLNLKIPNTSDHDYNIVGTWRVKQHGFFEAVRLMFEDCYTKIRPPEDDISMFMKK